MLDKWFPLIAALGQRPVRLAGVHTHHLRADLPWAPALELLQRLAQVEDVGAVLLAAPAVRLDELRHLSNEGLATISQTIISEKALSLLHYILPEEWNLQINVVVCNYSW